MQGSGGGIYRPAAILLDELDRVLLFRVMVEHHWWSLSEIASAQDCFAPRRMAELLTAVIAGEYPLEPVDTGK